MANAIVVLKSGSDPSSTKGYRPISLLPCILKPLEHIVTTRLTFHLESHNLISSAQFGFCKTHSTKEALWNFVFVANVALQSRKRTVIFSLDLQSAYDRVWHTGLIWKLASLGVPPYLLGWIASFLSDRVA